MSVRAPRWCLSPDLYDADEEAQAELVFVACDGCGRVAVENELLNCHWLARREVASSTPIEGRPVCTDCTGRPGTHWRLARSEEIRAAGFEPGEYV